MRTFYQVLVNTAVANVTTSFLWWALTFWAYLETRSVLATGVIGGAYMLFMALLGVVFGTVVDRLRKHRAMLLASGTTLAAFLVAGLIYLLQPESVLADLGGPWFWIFAAVILFGGVIENMRNIALSTTVTLLVPEERHANANGLVGSVTGIVFAVTSVFSGLAVGLLGLGWTLLIAIAFTAVTVVHLLFLRIPEEPPVVEERAPMVDFRGAIGAIRSVPGLFPLIVFATFNNLIGGVYMALMDPYGLQLFAVEWWGVVLAFASTGFIVGGLVVAKTGLGRNPIRTMLVLVVVMSAVGILFTIRDWWWLYALGMWVYMAIFPGIEAAEQTVVQKVVPYAKQGRVFGFAQAFESAAAPITSFLIAPIAQFWIIPYMDSTAGERAFGWLLGDGIGRGIALLFVVAGLIMLVVALLAFRTKAYGRISRQFTGPDAGAADPGDEERVPATA